ncbi:TetR/AcrR family transcriptional regulator [Sporichthya polymorpha]|uniref:TetR/AcrR family transcriptional regulator n=1 Tax=Sporichthya polymorpha TaxID=35751 RepID=UPI001FE10C66|nr:TetR/AcrR family transcriptional regulator [Sporichthya polymorpha]
MAGLAENYAGATMTAVSPSGPVGAKPDRRDLERSRLVIEQLLPAVERLLATETYPGLTVERIIVEAKISRSTFYKYFGDKTVLLQALLAEVMADIVDATRSLWQLPPEATPADLEDALRHVFTTHAPHAGLMRAVADAAAHEPATEREFLAQVEAGTVNNAEYIRAGQRAGVFRDDLDPEVAAEWLTWMVEHSLAQLSLRKGEFDPERAVQAAVAVFWKGLH